MFYGVIATLAVAPLALGNRGWYARLLASRPMVFLGEISYEIFLIHLVTMELVMVEILGFHDLHRLVGRAVRGDDGGDDPAGVAVAPVHAGEELGLGASAPRSTLVEIAVRTRVAVA